MTDAISPGLYDLSPDVTRLIDLTGVDYALGQTGQFNLFEEEYTDLAAPYGRNLGSRLRDPTPLSVPDRLVFSGYFDVLEHFDFLPTSLGVPVLSRRMHDLLTGLGNLRCEVYPARIIDAQDFDLDMFAIRQYADDARIDGHRHNDDYVVLHFLDRVDLAELWNEGATPERVDALGVPPLCMARDEAGLFVTAQAHDALIEAGIQGCVFTLPYRVRQPSN